MNIFVAFVSKLMVWEFFLLKDSNKGLFEYMLSSAFERFERLKELNFHAKNVYMGCQEATRLEGIQLLRGQEMR